MPVMLPPSKFEQLGNFIRAIGNVFPSVLSYRSEVWYLRPLAASYATLSVIINPPGGKRPDKVHGYTKPSQRKEEIQNKRGGGNESNNIRNTKSQLKQSALKVLIAGGCQEGRNPGGPGFMKDLHNIRESCQGSFVLDNIFTPHSKVSSTIYNLH
ncbi:hypothetical protein AVEN_210374-1 [Araneus ventricosus]|uniref:Uncharacterized protein n=1 Tax=Araneus ventricosus TaxID=182803 RepID=A0A4Y2T283_ARAVE|nr:hypothetical protein AVEN_210374-1 [Araneus ventricosus]